MTMPVRICACDCRMAAATRANVLLIGDPAIVRQMIRCFWAHETLPAWRQGRPFVLPEEAVTLLVYDLDNLSTDDQHRLSRWLETAPVPQIVSTTSTPLYPRVAAGTFDAALYYRLNTVCVDLQDASLLPVRQPGSLNASNSPL